MAHDKPPHQDLHCLQIQLFSSLVVKEFTKKLGLFEVFLRLDRKDVTFLIAVSELYQILPAENRVNLHLSL